MEWAQCGNIAVKVTIKFYYEGCIWACTSSRTINRRCKHRRTNKFPGPSWDRQQRLRGFTVPLFRSREPRQWVVARELAPSVSFGTPTASISFLAAAARPGGPPEDCYTATAGWKQWWKGGISFIECIWAVKCLTIVSGNMKQCHPNPDKRGGYVLAQHNIIQERHACKKNRCFYCFHSPKS